MYKILEILMRTLKTQDFTLARLYEINPEFGAEIKVHSDGIKVSLQEILDEVKRLDKIKKDIDAVDK